jgi:hypothetical protein
MSESEIGLFLSSKGLQRIEAIDHERDFTFVVGDQRHPCPSFVAEYLSPRVASLRSQDITIDEFSIETADAGHRFGALLSIGFGRRVSFSKHELEFVRSVCAELWNSELFETTLTQESPEITEAELRARLALLSLAISEGDSTGDCGVSVVAAHFHQYSVADLDQLSPSVLGAILGDPALVVQDEDSVFEIVHRRASKDLAYFGLFEFVRFDFLSIEYVERAIELMSSSFELFTFGIWSSLRIRFALSVAPTSRSMRCALPDFDSTIIMQTPPILSHFRRRGIHLLYRGSRDGFDAEAFHRRCDGHPNTVTLIASTNDCIFGGYTPLVWRSRNMSPPDPSRDSFLFTIKNPYNLPAQIFKQQRQDCAIRDYGRCGPCFGSGYDLYVGENCQTTNGCWSKLGETYSNVTGILGNRVLTGAEFFTVKDIEVFEVVGPK